MGKAVESVLNQTFKDFEVILVDDGSRDNSGKICDLFQEKDSRVVVIHQENGGICNARNQAIAIAKGEYIAFCDNDDIMLPECLEKAISVTRKHPIY